MSAATSRTLGSARSDLITDTAAGPPAPVTSTVTDGQAVSSGRIRHLPRRRGARARLGGRAPVRYPGDDAALAVHDALGRGQLGRAGRGTLPDHLERLGEPRLAVPGPVARTGRDQVGFQVGPDLHLGCERVDGGQLAVQLVVD